MAVGRMGGREAQSVLSDPSAASKDKLLVTGDKGYPTLPSMTINTTANPATVIKVQLITARLSSGVISGKTCFSFCIFLYRHHSHQGLINSIISSSSFFNFNPSQIMDYFAFPCPVHS